MKIQKLRIINYKIFQDTIIELQDMNIFVGENNAGKSTILQALTMILTGRLNGISLINSLSLDWFNLNAREKFKNDISEEKYLELPKIIIEAYFSEDDEILQEYMGTNNTLRENASGVSLVIEFDERFEKIYRQLLDANRIDDIPVEYYTMHFRSFSGSEYRMSNISRKVVSIDTTKRDYDFVLNKFISGSIDKYLTEEDIADLRHAYREQRGQFTTNKVVSELNSRLLNASTFDSKSMSINLRENKIDEWKNFLTLSLDKIPLENIGLGLQKMLKTNLFLQQRDNMEILLMEEPENNLSYTNMENLVSKLGRQENKQIFLTTHSSFVANKLGLQYLYMVADGGVYAFKCEVSDETYEYFMKLPGYDTLRVLLASKVILVEGPTDELILQRAYYDRTQRYPFEDKVDVIAISGLAFERYCELAKIINKHITVVTDNDGNFEKVEEKYKNYIDDGIVTLCVEHNNELHTIEPSVVHANRNQLEKFQGIIQRRKSKKIEAQDLINFMTNNKTTWSLRVFESEDCIEYPEYIDNAVDSVCDLKRQEC